MPRAQRRRLAWLGPVCMLSLGCGAAPAGEAAPAVTEGVAEPPAASADLAVQDVVLITVDTLRADAVGFGGAGPGVTPNMDRLAAAGRVYDNAHAHNVVTLPSHANMLTGLLPYQHGVRDNAGFRLGASTPTLATILDQAKLSWSLLSVDEMNQYIISR